MKLKLNIIDRIAGILLGIKLTNIEDEIVKNNLLRTFLAVRKFAKEFGDEQQELVAKFNEDLKDTDRNSPEYQRALADLNKAIGLAGQREVEVQVTPVELDAFMASVKDDALTFEQTAILSENGILN